MPSSTLLAALVNFLTAAMALGLALIVLWENAHSRTNRLFAGFLLALCPYGIASVLNRYTDEFDLDLSDGIRVSTVFFTIALIFLILFNFEFARSTERWMRMGQALTAIVALASTAYFAAGDWLEDPHITSAGHVSYHTSPLTKLSMLFAISMLVASAWALWHSERKGSRALFWPVSLTPLGFSSFFVPVLDDLPMLSITLAAVALLTARVVLRLELFDPLAQLNKELAASNNRLNKALQDLTASNADLAEAHQRQSTFLADMSHELRTPLNSIIGFSDLLLQGTYGPLSDTQSDRLTHVLRNSQHLLRLINDLLDLSKINAGQMQLTRVAFDPVPVLDTLVETIHPLVASKGLQFERRYQELPPLCADEARFQQIMMNLLSNAVKYTHTGTLSLEGAVEDGMARLVVRDTGIGIPPKHLEHIFDEFYQVATRRTPHSPGTGLGLAIARRLVELHGGRIWVESEVNTGSAFFVTMPLAPTPESQEA